MKQNKKRISLILSMLLIAILAGCLTGCNSKKDAAVTETTVYQDGAVVGEGSTSFEFTVVNAQGEEITLEIHTDKETVGDALLENSLIAGENGEYGLYVKTVNGETVDYDTDGKYWAFYINGEYGMTGVDTTNITEGDSYAFKVE